MTTPETAVKWRGQTGQIGSDQMLGAKQEGCRRVAATGEGTRSKTRSPPEPLHNVSVREGTVVAS